MTKTQLQQELKEKVKEGVKPSHLKRSKSLGDIPANPLLPLDDKGKQIEFLIKENTRLGNELLETKQQLKKANDDWLSLAEKQSQRIKDQKPNPRIAELEKELEDNVNEAVEELEKKDKEIRKLKQELGTTKTQLRATQQDLNIHQRAAEFRLNNPFKDHKSNFWEDYGMIIMLVGLYVFSTWILRNTNYESK